MNKLAIILFALGAMSACQKSPPSLDSQSQATTQPVGNIAAPAIASVAPVAASAGSVAPSAVAEPAQPVLCRELCAASAPLHCRAAAECAQHCQQMMDMATCRSEMLITLRCFAKQPVQNWECDSDGLPSIRAGFCDPEQEKFTNCMQPK
jgi:hypothetical protein